MDDIKPVGVAELRRGASRLSNALRSGVLAVFVLTCAAEAALLIAIPTAAIDFVMAFVAVDPGAATSRTPNALIVLAAIGLALIELLRGGLYSPLRRAALDDVPLTAGEAFRLALRRAVPVFLVQQLIGVCVMAATFLAVALRLPVTVLPYILVSFALAPAVYLVSAHDRGVLSALVAAITITRKNFLAVFGVQSALLLFAVWLGELLQSTLAFGVTFDVIATVALISIVSIYRFAQFGGMSTLFLALDERGHAR